MMLLRTDDPATWDELEKTYLRLHDSKQGVAVYGYLNSAGLLALAERLEKILEREEKPARYDPTRPRRGWFG